MRDFALKNAKAVWAFVLTWLGNMAFDFLESGQPLPQTRDEWVRYIGTSLLITAGVYIPRNKQTERQVNVAVEKDLGTEETATVAANALEQLPEGVRNNIEAYRSRET